MSPEKTPVYIILGSAGSGRRELLADLIADGLASGDQPAVLLSDAEAPHSLDAKLPPGPRWTWQPGPPAAIHCLAASTAVTAASARATASGDTRRGDARPAARRHPKG